MQKWTALLFVVLVLGSVGVLVRAGMNKNAPKSAAEPVATAQASADAGPGDAGSSEPGDAEAPVEGPGEPEPTTQTDAGGTLLLNGEAPPALAAEAPKSVVFGVILVQYKGAQGAPTNARSKDAALELAKQLADEAQKDFKAAVQKGDKGSMDNAGRLPRGVLEPAPEFELFNLAKGGVSKPVDTPRGYWIVQRIE